MRVKLHIKDVCNVHNIRVTENRWSCSKLHRPFHALRVNTFSKSVVALLPRMAYAGG